MPIEITIIDKKYLDPVLKCKLENGEVHAYDICDEKETLGSLYDCVKDEIEYIGFGEVYILNGEIERSANKKKYHFWRYKKFYKPLNANKTSDKKQP